jgi:hypothetical protein
MNYLSEVVYVAKAFIHYMTSGPAIVVINDKLVKIPVFHRGRLMAIYLEYDKETFEYGQLSYVECEGCAGTADVGGLYGYLNPLPVPGLRHFVSPNHFGVKQLTLCDDSGEAIKTYTGDEEISFLKG